MLGNPMPQYKSWRSFSQRIGYGTYGFRRYKGANGDIVSHLRLTEILAIFSQVFANITGMP
jgi:hypothetical protein